jgi:hypothetical protein
MKIGYWWPAYRMTVRVETAHTLIRDFQWAMMSDHLLIPWYTARNNVAMARNEALERAIQGGFDRLMMVDSDCGYTRALDLT